MTTQRVIALLGRRDQPTDAVEDYCRYLGEALAADNVQLEIRRVSWNEHGWAASLEALRLQSQAWRGVWVLVQYTALAWSARGFPWRFLQILRALRKASAKLAVVFHDAEPFGGARVIDRLRRMFQLRVMHRSIALTDQSVFTVAPEQLSWVGRMDMQKDWSLIPVGANLPSLSVRQKHEKLHSPPTVAVFSITGGTAGDCETRDVIAALRQASVKLGTLRLLVFGRHAELREQALREALKDVTVTVDIAGVVDGHALLQKFAEADVLLFVRGTISSRRSSAISGIACGLPVIALRGSETAPPITNAGVFLLPENLEEQVLQSQLAEALVRILSDNELRAELVQRSSVAYAEFFAWPAIASRYCQFLREPD
jgi:glycosyltransferase involved in cell wall biosynthesis